MNTTPPIVGSLARLLRATLALVAPAACLTGCAGIHEGAPRPARINHVVLVTLQDPSQRDELLKEADAVLARVPGVAVYAAGPALNLGRPEVDSAFDLGMFMGFDTVEAYRAYIADPQHQKFVTTWRPRVKSLVIHDYEDPTP